MALLPLRIKPGVFRNGTVLQAAGRWLNAHLIRFLEGALRPIGGWEPLQAAGVDIDTTSTALFSDTGDHTLADNIEQVTPEVKPASGWVVGSTLETLVTVIDSPGVPNYFRWTANANPVWPLTIDNIVSAGETFQDTLEMFADVNFVEVRAGNDHSLLFRATASVDPVTLNEPTDYFRVHCDPQDAPANTVGFKMWHRIGDATASAVTVPAAWAADLAVNPGAEVDGTDGLRYGFILTPGNMLQLYTEPYGGGARTLHGAAFDITNSGTFDALRTTSNLKVGCVGLSRVDDTSDTRMANFTARAKADRVARALLAYRDNSSSAALLAIGTNQSLLNFAEGVLTDITPAGLTTGNVDSIPAVGLYGGGLYSGFNFGEGDPAQGSLVEAASWQLDTFGDVLLGVLTSDGVIYEYSGSGLATAVANAPVNNDALVVTSERFVVALGAAGDPRLVQWSDQEDRTTWTPDATNSAGSFPLTGAGAIMCGRRGRNETIIWTTKELFGMQFIGGTLVYAFKQLGSECGIISRNAAAIVDGKAIWMSQRGFYVYDGFVRSLPSDVSDDVFKDFNRTQRAKVFALPFTDFGEVWFFYPSSTSDEPDKYVIYNYRENHWTNGSLSRTAGVGRGVFEFPMAAESGGAIQQHEKGMTKTGVAAPFLESGPVQLGAGDKLVQVIELIPDEATLAGQVLGSVNATLKGRLYPTATETTVGPITLANPTPQRFTARQVRLRLDEIAAGDWRVGLIRLNVKPAGER